jgi:hypothetical protein
MGVCREGIVRIAGGRRGPGRTRGRGGRSRLDPSDPPRLPRHPPERVFFAKFFQTGLTVGEKSDTIPPEGIMGRVVQQNACVIALERARCHHVSGGKRPFRRDRHAPPHPARWPGRCPPSRAGRGAVVMVVFGRSLKNRPVWYRLIRAAAPAFTRSSGDRVPNCFGRPGHRASRHRDARRSQDMSVRAKCYLGKRLRRNASTPPKNFVTFAAGPAVEPPFSLQFG